MATKLPEKPKQKQNETDDDFKKRLDAWTAEKHKVMLRKQAEPRVPRIVAAILSAGALAVHNPTEAQVKAIMDPIEKAVAAVKERLSGRAAKKPAFVLPE